jgi:alkanesulfonate monooxygenase SsuD/methylene tetrahydromethanopterin reductase-like flavin-dependent oxidoreductase (luciferase family)
LRFSYAESMTSPAFYAPLARAAEDAGYDSMVVPDSICYPERSDSVYPFNPDGTREFLEDKPFLEPFSLIPALGAVTERLRFITFVLKLPVRNPVLVAKQVTSTAVLTGNRLVLGVGSSPWREDYEVLGVPWEGRGRRMDEELAIIRGLSAGGYFAFHGDVFDAGAERAGPDPGRRARGRRAAARGTVRGRLAARRRGPGGPARPARPAGRVPPPGGHHGPSIRSARDLHGRL